MNRTIYSILFFLCLKGMALAFPLDDIIRRALETKPLSVAAEKKTEAALWGKRSLYSLPSPRIFYAKEDFEDFSRLNEREADKYGLSQEIPFPYLWYLELKQQGEKVEISRLERKRIQGKIIKSIVNAFYDYSYLNEEIEVFQGLREEMKNFMKRRKKAFDLGEISEAEYLKTVVEVTKIKALILELERKKKTALNGLEYHANGKFDKQYLKHAFRLELENRMAAETVMPSKADNILLNIKEKEKAAAQWGFRESLFSWLPSLELEWSRKELKFPDGEKQSVKAAFRFPLWLWGPPYGEARVGRAEKEVKKYEYLAYEMELERLIKDLRLDIRALKENKELFEKDVLPNQKKIYENSLKGYEKGEFDYARFWEGYHDYYHSLREYYDVERSLRNKTTELGCQTLRGKFRLLKENKDD